MVFISEREHCLTKNPDEMFKNKVFSFPGAQDCFIQLVDTQKVQNIAGSRLFQQDISRFLALVFPFHLIIFNCHQKQKCYKVKKITKTLSCLVNYNQKALAVSPLAYKSIYSEEVFHLNFIKQNFFEGEQTEIFTRYIYSIAIYFLFV